MMSFVRKLIHFVILFIASIAIAISVFLIMKKVRYTFQREESKERSLTGSLNFAQHHVLLVMNGNYACSGTLIHKKYVLTLAQCVFDSFKENTYKTNMKVVVGTRSFPGGTSYDVDKIICHPSFDPRNYKDNIAVVRLTKDVLPSGGTYGAYPIPLPDETKISSEKREFLVNSFRRIPRSPYSILDQHQFYMQIVSNGRCRKFFASIMNPLHFSGEFCAVAVPQNRPCLGDSGGPATVKHKYIIGIYMSLKKCKTRLPELFIDVTSYLEFIKSAIE